VLIEVVGVEGGLLDNWQGCGEQEKNKIGDGREVPLHCPFKAARVRPWLSHQWGITMKTKRAQKAGRRNSRRSTCDQDWASTHLSPDISCSSSDMLPEREIDKVRIEVERGKSNCSGMQKTRKNPPQFIER